MRYVKWQKSVLETTDSPIWGKSLHSCPFMYFVLRTYKLHVLQLSLHYHRYTSVKLWKVSTFEKFKAHWKFEKRWSRSKAVRFWVSSQKKCRSCISSGIVTVKLVVVAAAWRNTQWGDFRFKPRHGYSLLALIPHVKGGGGGRERRV
jgi:hypothetical protein